MTTHSTLTEESVPSIVFEIVMCKVILHALKRHTILIRYLMKSLKFKPYQIYHIH